MQVRAIRKNKKDINAAISRAIPMHGADVTHWKHSKQLVSGVGHQANSLYTIAKSMKGRNSKGFFGHGDWYEYLRKEHGVNSLSPSNMPDARLHSHIGVQLKRLIKEGTPVNPATWYKNTKPVSPTGQGLKHLYFTAWERKRNGKPFFGYGDWETYLAKKHKVKIKTHKPGKRGKTYSNDYVMKQIKIRLESGMSPERMEWKTTNEVEGLHSPASLLKISENRRVNGKAHFGFGTWNNLVFSLAPEPAAEHFGKTKEKVAPRKIPIFRRRTLARRARYSLPHNERSKLGREAALEQYKQLNPRQKENVKTRLRQGTANWARDGRKVPQRTQFDYTPKRVESLANLLAAGMTKTKAAQIFVNRRKQYFPNLKPITVRDHMVRIFPGKIDPYVALERYKQNYRSPGEKMFIEAVRRGPEKNLEIAKKRAAAISPEVRLRTALKASKSRTTESISRGARRTWANLNRKEKKERVSTLRTGLAKSIKEKPGLTEMFYRKKPLPKGAGFEMQQIVPVGDLREVIGKREAEKTISMPDAKTIQREVSKLPVKQQQVITRHFFEGRPLKEISIDMLLNESTVKQLLGKAMAKLGKNKNLQGIFQKIE